MKISRKMLRNLGIILTGLSLGLTSACSSSQQDEEDLELSGEDSANQQGNLGEDDASEGNGQENYVDGNESEENNEQGADTNSDTENEFASDDAGGMNPTLDNSAGMAAPEPMAAPASSEKSPIPGGRVRYVPQGGVQVVSGPGGAPVASLEQGDHPLTWEENGWLRISTGMYVPVDSLSDKGVGRPMSGNSWK